MLLRSLFVVVVLILVNTCAASSGNLYYKNESLDSIHGNGLVKIVNCTISESVHVNGSLSCEDSIVGSLHVNGQASIKNSTIQGNSTISGFLESVSSKFQSEMTVSSQKIILKASVIDSLVINDVGEHLPEIVELKNGTTINGSITFRSGKGEVIMDSNCKILGKVKGGIIRR